MKKELTYQVIFLLLIIGVAYFIYVTTQANLQRLGVDSGFDFLFKRAGFEISQTLIAYDANSSILRAFIVALLNTLLLAFTAIACASVLGLIIGIARLSQNWLVSHLATLYVEIFRNIPSLLQIFFWYFVVLRALPPTRESITVADTVFLNNRGLFFPAPDFHGHGVMLLASIFIAVILCFALGQWNKRKSNRSRNRVSLNYVYATILITVPLLFLYITGLTWEVPVQGRFSYQGGFVLMPEFMALVVGLSMYNATYIAEIVRSGFSSIPRGQSEAAESLGLPGHLILSLILFPQALRVIIPPLTTVYLNLFKSTSLAAAIAYPEVISVFVGTVNNLVGQPVTIMAMTLIIYALISLSIAIFLNWYNRRISLTVG